MDVSVFLARRFAAVAVAALLALGARAETYLLQPGDALRLSLAGLPELDATATIDMNGFVLLPPADRVAAAGRTLDDVEHDVRAVIGGQAVKRYTEDGAPIFIGLAPEDARLSVEAYRPVFVGGFVRTPGSVPFQPGLSVRAALTTAGGVGDPERGGAAGPTSRLVEQRLAFLDRIARAIELWRAQAELAEAPDAPPPPAPADDAGGAAFASALAMARMRLDADLASLRTRRRFLDLRLDQITAREETLRRQAENERAGLAEDDAEFARITGLFERGLVPIGRLSDVRRAQLASATRVLQTESSLSSLDFLREDARREAAEAEESRAQRLRGEIAEGAAALRALDVRLADMEAGFVGGGAAQTPAWRLVVHRRGAEGESSLPADPGMALLPGDILEVQATTITN